MDAHGIDLELKDSFIEHAVNFDSDDNGYLKKAELEDAAKAWNDQSTGDAAEESEAAEEEELLKKSWKKQVNHLRVEKHAQFVLQHVLMMLTLVQPADFLSLTCESKISLLAKTSLAKPRFENHQILLRLLV